MILFKIVPIEEIKLEILKEEGNVQNFPKTVDFPFPECYKKLVTLIKTTEISTETILYSAVEAFNNNKEFVSTDHWCFAGNGQGDHWLMDKEHAIFFYDHDYDEKLQPMNIHFEQWLQMAYVIQQLDAYFSEHEDISESVREGFYDALNAIHPKLAENYPFIT
ncbi:SMI1/KNR4 family protein [Chryseobacterium sp. c4a]|uniref:SMI1/KNR4 family protein n=1 Tax=Chryseobacterium sp. c4a TaxID=1573582 RepID=UPI0013593C96|nr:SMI1/KNR4 family protein [Chryseobacterium sp. c4a]